VTVTDLAERIAHMVPGEVAVRVAADPRSALRDDFGLSVRDVPELANRRGAGGWCDGMSFLDHNVVLIATTGNRRDNFTAVHEVAHLLVLRDDDAMNWLADHPDPGTAEELLCDRVASRLLVPPTVVARLLAGDPPRARHIADLHAATSASEPVCAIALSEHLPCQGAVVITTIGGTTVTYASINPAEDGWPVAYPWPGRDIPPTHLLRRVGAHQTRTERSWWATPWGDRQVYYLDVVTSARRAHTVLAANDLWQADAFHGGDGPVTSGRPERHLTCPCGYDGQVRGYPCSNCRQPYCPQCRRCRCERQDAQLVDCPNPNCYLRVMPHQVHGDRCVNCG